MSNFKRLFAYSRRYLPSFIIGLLLALIAAAFEKANPYLSKLIVDDVLKTGKFDKLGYLISLMIGAILIRAIALYGKLYCFEYMSQKIIYILRSELYDKLQAQSFEFYDKSSVGHLMNRMVGDLNAVRDLINNGYSQFFQSTVSLILTFIIMFSLDVSLTSIILIIVPFLFFNARTMKRKLHLVFKKIRTAFENLTSFVQENITGIRVVKSFGHEEMEKENFKEVNKDFADGNIRAADIRAKYGPRTDLIIGIGLVIILFYGGYIVMKGNMTIGDLVAFNGYMVMLRAPIKHLTNIVDQWENAMASLEKIYYIMDQKPAIENRDGAVVFYEVKGDIRFENVYFKYSNEYVLKNINLHMPPGSVTAIMGATGSGKSTIINLIARFYDCTRGRVLIDGYDVRDVEMNSLRKHIGIILQDIFLFSDTIASNIAFGRPDATREEIERAARIADAHDFIMNLPDGYDTVVGERGVGLSGGQKQRIAIARAILSDPQILILDDATSSVDMETEREIQNTLREIMANRTTLIIAHRISSVKDADQIIYLEDGVIAERGTHQELLQMKGKYYKTFLEQYREYAEDNKVSVGPALISEV
jgi:ATP-binding cassette subfamily B protein